MKLDVFINNKQTFTKEIMIETISKFFNYGGLILDLIKEIYKLIFKLVGLYLFTMISKF